MLLVVVLYLIANIALSTVWEHNRKGIAVVCHALLFGFTFILVLFCSDVPLFRNIMVDLLGSQYDKVISEIVVVDLPVIVPFALVEIVVLLQMVFTALYFTTKVVVKFNGCVRKHYEFIRDDSQQKTCDVYIENNKRLFYKLSVLLC